MKLGLQIIDAVDDKGLVGYVRDILLRLRMMIDNAHLGFGDGVNRDNMFGTWVNYTTNAVANTEDTINHNLGFVPVGWLVVTQDKAGSIYKGTTTWTTSQIFLKCSVASVTARIFVLGPSNQSF